MTIYIDSAILKEVKSAQALGWVHGVTTNPLLLARAGGNPYEVFNSLAQLKYEQIFYQLVSTTLENMNREALSASEIAGQTLVLKIPPTEIGYKFVSRYGNQFSCCVTAVYSPAQALVAGEAGARYVVVYVNRATRLMGDGIQLVRDIADILKNYSTEILAASIKSTKEACASISAGAHHLTLPYEVLTSLIRHPLSEQTVAEFQAGGTGINL